jgi:hypothetical protein
MIAGPVIANVEFSKTLVGQPDVVGSSWRLGSARAARQSLGPSMLRRAAHHRWSVETVRWDVDRMGYGEIAYRVDAEGHALRFDAFSHPWSSTRPSGPTW